jgi:hypothetical protein
MPDGPKDGIKGSCGNKNHSKIRIIAIFFLYNICKGQWGYRFLVLYDGCMANP